MGLRTTLLCAILLAASGPTCASERILVPLLSDGIVRGADNWLFAPFVRVVPSSLATSLFLDDGRGTPLEVPNVNEVLRVAGSGGRFVLAEFPGNDRPTWYPAMTWAHGDRGGVTALPIVRETDFRSGATTFPRVDGIFAGDPTRSTLRIYLERPPTAALVFRVDVFGVSSGVYALAATTAIADFDRGPDASYAWTATLNMPGPFGERCQLRPPPLHDPSLPLPCYDGFSLVITPNDPSLHYFPIFSSVRESPDGVVVTWPQ